MKKLLFVTLAAVLVVGVVARVFAMRMHRRSEALAERPVQVKLSTPPLETHVSTIGATVTIRYAVLADILNGEVPESQNFEGREHFKFDVTTKVEKQVREKVGGDVGKVLGRVAKFVLKTVTVDQIDHISGDVNYHGAVSRGAPFQVAAMGSGVRISVPLSIHGQAGINGDLAKFLKLDKKNIDGAMNAWSDCTFGLQSDWSPQITAKPDFQWESASIEIAGNVRISIRSVTEGPLKNQLDKLPEALMKKLNGESVRQAVLPLWKPYSVKLQLSEANAYLHLVPSEVALSEVGYTAEGVRLSLALRVNSQGSLTPTSQFSLPSLPNLATLAAEGNRLHIDVPLTVNYDALSSVASNALGKRPFSISTAAGPAQIKFGQVEMYPISEGRIAVGCRTEIDFSEKPTLSAKGEVYFLAEPYMDEARQQIGLRKLSFRRLLDNQLWQLVSVIFEKEIIEVIQNSTTLNLTPKLAEAQKALEMAAASPQVNEYGAISIRDLKLSIGDLSLTDRAFIVHARGEGELLLTLENIRVRP